MTRRIDYLEDPDAPKPTTVVPSANVIVTNDKDELLFIRRVDSGNYALPGGGMDVGESMTDTAIRECLEETGYHIEVDGLVGIFTNPGHVILYTSNGEVRQEFAVVYYGHVIGGSPRTDSESTELVWVPRGKAAELRPMHASMRYRIDVYLGSDMPHIDRAGEVSNYLRGWSSGLSHPNE